MPTKYILSFCLKDSKIREKLGKIPGNLKFGAKITINLAG
jgi:hypothetical protein